MSIPVAVVAGACSGRPAPPPVAPEPATILAEPPMSDAAWQACAARITREPMGNGLVAIRFTPALVAAVTPDDGCADASRLRDGSFYAAVREVAVNRSPYMLVGRDADPPRLDHAADVETRDDEVLVRLRPQVTILGCHPVAEADRGHVVRADVAAEPPPGNMYWIAPTERPVRFVRDEAVGYDSCHVIRSAAEVGAATIPEAMRAPLQRATAGVDFAREMVVFEPADVEEGALHARACETTDREADPDASSRWARGPSPYPPLCIDRPDGLEVTMWRDVDPPCSGIGPPPGQSAPESHWRPRLITPLVITPRRDGPVTRVVADTLISPPCA